MTLTTNPAACKVRVEGPSGPKLDDHVQRLRTALAALDPTVEIEIVKLDENVLENIKDLNQKSFSLYLKILP